MKWRIAFCVLTLLINTTNTYADVIKLSPKQEYTFTIKSEFKRAPVTVHEQNKDFVAVSCRNTADVEENTTHSCTLSITENAPKNSTFAIFQKKPVIPDNILFHVSVNGE